MVRELVSRKGRTAVTLRFRSLAESEPGDTECSLALDCATLLLGATAVEATWLAASAAPGDLLLQGEGQGCGKLVRGTGRGMPLPVRKAFYIGRQSPDFLRPKLDYCRPKQFYCRPRPAAQMLPISPGEVCVNDVDTCVLIPWLGVLTNKHSPPFRGWWRRALRVGACAVGGQTAGFKRRPRG
jgi:hypothetical protein